MDPFYSQTTASGIRQWQGHLNNEKLSFRRSPGDFVLFELGTWDLVKGEILQHDAKRSLGTGLELMEKN